MRNDSLRVLYRPLVSVVQVLPEGLACRGIGQDIWGRISASRCCARRRRRLYSRNRTRDSTRRIPATMAIVMPTVALLDRALLR